ncbi:alkaline ceramidase 3 isoform X4 [Hemitrygon akajei]|uniref:alkaline ceramidase 3 isoform X4 n=1 Tax=Hemitrygon akajei TaxID=2704970 RepID=UPI003BF943C5
MAPVFDRPGFWGEPTSTLDWCEENYAVSFYVAEFWNTVSNLIMIVPPVYGAIQTVRDGLETRYLAAFLGLAAVGIGSWCFHMTLKYEMQLLDELPMIYSCCIFVYCLYECFKHKNTRNYLLAFILVLFSGIVTIVYLEWKEPVFHQGLPMAATSCLYLLRCVLDGLYSLECGQHLMWQFEGGQAKSAIPSPWCPDTIPCMVAHSNRPRLIPAHSFQYVHKNFILEIQA